MVSGDGWIVVRIVAYRASSQTFGKWIRHSPAIGATAVRVSAFNRNSLSQLRVDDECRPRGAFAFLRIDYHTAVWPGRFHFCGSKRSAFDLFHSPPRPAVEIQPFAR